jgi:arylsulfatase
MLSGLYNGNESAVNFAQLLSDAGYTTIHSGKEHFDNWVPKSCYAENVFDQSFTFWATTEYFIPPDSVFSKPFFLDGKELATSELIYKESPFYKTDVITEYGLKFLEEELKEKPDNPFLLYLPYHSAHYPLQAKPSDIDKYRETYKVGWDEIRQDRYEKMLKLGIIDKKYKLSEPSDNINKFRGHPKGDEEIRKKIPLYRPWNDLEKREQDELALEMAVFAGMVDCLDQNIGRVIQWLKDHDKYENTLIVFLSDNGSCPYDSNKDFDVPPGPANSYRTLSAAWANVGNTPFKYFKQFGHEGGARTHCIIHWPNISPRNKIVTQVGHIADLYPTFLDVAETNYPKEYNEIATISLDGKSLRPILYGNRRVNPKYFISGFSDRFRMFRKGSYKIVKANADNWELYDMKDDPTEMNDLSSKYPDVTERLVKEYQEINIEHQNRAKGTSK